MPIAYEPEKFWGVVFARRGSAVPYVIKRTVTLTVIAGAVKQRTRTLSELGDALQGGQTTWRRMKRAEDKQTRTGFDHHVAHPVDLSDGRRMLLVLTFKLDPLHDAIADKQRLVLWYLLFDFFAVLLFIWCIFSRSSEFQRRERL